MSKVILTHEVDGLGSAGDVVDVKNGFARNYLIPQGFGVAWTRGAVPYASGAYGARVDERAVRALAAEPAVARVQVDLPVTAPEPLESSAQETRIGPARRALRAADGTELDGRGTLVVDIDSPVFVYHPGLFRADAGVFPWVDVDGDGALTPGVDGVDLDLDGVVAPAEVLPFTDEDFAATPGLVRGYIGPQDLPAGVRYVVDPLVVRGSAWVTGANVNGQHAVNVVYGRDFEADGVLLATGAHPRVVAGAEPDGERILDWRQLYDLPELPEHLVVIGSGVAGAEFANAYLAVGSAVTLVSSRDRVLPGEDADAAELLEEVFARRGMNVRRGRAARV